MMVFASGPQSNNRLFKDYPHLDDHTKQLIPLGPKHLPPKKGFCYKLNRRDKLYEALKIHYWQIGKDNKWIGGRGLVEGGGARGGTSS